MSAEAVSIREVVDQSDPVVAAFDRLQRATYFAPETLIPSEYIARMLGDGRRIAAGRQNFLLVAEVDGRLVGGTFFHWLAAAQAGFSSFMAVDGTLRGHGVGRRLHEERFRVLDRAAGGRAQGVFIDVVNPTRLTAEELARERRVGSDPWDRRRILAHLGFRQVDVPYEQPVGGPDGGPVTNLDLLYCPREPTDAIPTALLLQTMRAYWSAWVPSAERHVQELGARAGRTERLALIWPVPKQPVGNPPY